MLEAKEGKGNAEVGWAVILFCKFAGLLRMLEEEGAKEQEKENQRGGEDLNPRPRDLESRALPN